MDRLARSIESVGLPQPLRVDAARAAIAAGDPDSAQQRAEDLKRGLLQPVINATGVLLHTNLGRAPLAVTTSGQANNLEFDLGTGKRGSRASHAGGLIARAVGADDAIVVNNGASAVMLALAALARGAGVAVSRGELVEIGGGFRVPDVMAESGARLVEIGTTNRTRTADYEAVLDDVSLLLKVHRSNYTITGFTEETSVSELAKLGPPVVVDLGSGLVDAACPWLPDGPPPWLAGEPAAKQTLEAGARLVIFSGDKLFAGPQAGVIAGRSDLVQACAGHPLYRAFRPGGLVLSALQDVALSYLDRRANELPFWRMATLPVPELEDRAERVLTELDAPDTAQRAQGRRELDGRDVAEVSIEVVRCSSVTGGGTLPGVEIPSIGLGLGGDHTTALRAHEPPVIARVADDMTILDLRTVDPADDAVVASALSLVVRP